MSIYELKILFDLNPESKSKTLDKYAKKFYHGYFFVDSEDGQCYLFDDNREEKDVSLVHKINKDMILEDIEKIVIPNNVISIKDWAFYNCSKLTSVMIGNSVTSIGVWAFFYCNNLKSLIFKGKTINQVKSMKNYPFSIKNESVIKVELS